MRTEGAGHRRLRAWQHALLLMTLVAGSPTPGVSQDRVTAHAMAGVAGLGGDPHYHVGGYAAAFAGTPGIAAFGAIGNGGGLESQFLAGGVAIQAWPTRRAGVQFWLGGGYLAEEGWSGIERSTSGPAGGVVVLLNLGAIGFSASTHALLSQYDGDDVTEPLKSIAARASFGVGFHVGKGGGR